MVSTAFNGGIETTYVGQDSKKWAFADSHIVIARSDNLTSRIHVVATVKLGVVRNQRMSNFIQPPHSLIRCRVGVVVWPKRISVVRVTKSERDVLFLTEINNGYTLKDELDDHCIVGELWVDSRVSESGQIVILDKVAQIFGMLSGISMNLPKREDSDMVSRREMSIKCDMLPIGVPKPDTIP
jgi:hypothetical protein